MAEAAGFKRRLRQSASSPHGLLRRYAPRNDEGGTPWRAGCKIARLRRPGPDPESSLFIAAATQAPIEAQSGPQRDDRSTSLAPLCTRGSGAPGQARGDERVGCPFDFSGSRLGRPRQIRWPLAGALRQKAAWQRTTQLQRFPSFVAPGSTRGHAALLPKGSTPAGSPPGKNPCRRHCEPPQAARQSTNDGFLFP